MHLAYFVKPADGLLNDNPELRYSLRSAEVNLPHIESVWIVGGKPTWLDGVHHVEGNRFDTKQRNVYDNVRIIAEHPAMPDEVVVMNDDFMTMHPASPEAAWRCDLLEHIEGLRPECWWQLSLIATHDWLAEQGHAEPLSYELHRPFPVVRARMAETLARAAHVQPDNPPQWRTLYGNEWAIGGQQDDDGKMYNRATHIPSGPWLSTTDGSWRRSRRLRLTLQAAFPEPSRWEADDAQPA